MTRSTLRLPQKKKKRLAFVAGESLFSGAGPDQGVLLTLLALVIFGWVMVYSSSALFAETHFRSQYFFVQKQVLWSLIGIACFFAAAHVKIPFWQKAAWPLYVVTLIPLILVLFLGPEIAGARRWLRIGAFSLQPSEMAKLAVVVLAADYLDRRQSRLTDFRKGVLPLLIFAAVPLALILVEPDLGTPFLIGAVLLTMMVLGGVRWRHLLLLGAAALPLVALAIANVGYRLDRFLAYLNPWADAQGAGYQLVQSLMALGSGGVVGRGLGASRLKAGSLPDAHTDFVFAVLGEELGLAGTLLCAGLFFFLCMRGLRIAKEAPDLFSRLLAAGISLTIGYQAAINMGVATGLLPTKGMPLPFLSFGGSSLVVLMTAMGILARISRQNRLKE